MRAATARLLACPDTGAPLRIDVGIGAPGRTAYGVLRGDTDLQVPVCGGFVLWSESAAGSAPWSVEDVQQLEAKLFGPPPGPLSLIGHRPWDEVRDRQAAAQPFEAQTRDLLGMVKALAPELPPKGIILVIGDQGGWIAENVAVLFPSRIVVLTADPDDRLLGYAGFRQWLGEGCRAANLEIVFVRRGAALPLAKGGAALVIDCAGGPAAVEFCAPDGWALRTGAPPVVLHAGAGKVPMAVVPHWDGHGESRVLIDPSLPLDLDRQTVGHERQPLTTREAELLYLAGKALPVCGIAAKLGRPLGEVADELRALERRGLIQLVPVGEAMVRLQRFLATGEVLPPLARQTLAALVPDQFRRFAERPLAIAGGIDEEICYADALELIGRIAAVLRAEGVGKGDRLLVQTSPHREALLLFWAALSIGAVFVPVDPQWPRAILDAVRADAAPRLEFMDASRANAAGAGSRVVFDPVEGDPALAEGGRWFSDWLSDAVAPPGPETAVLGSDAAVVLYTSGTTGLPKGVELSQAALFRSGLVVAQAFAVNERDVLLIPGDFHSISGLRNQFVVPVLAGGSTVLPETEFTFGTMHGLAEMCGRHGVTILGGNPQMYRRLARFAASADPVAFRSMRMMWSVASPLHQGVVEALQRHIPVPLCDFYGLTETSGSAIFGDTKLGGSFYVNGGRPIGVLAQIVDDQGRPCAPGEVGEVRIFSDRGLTGYLNKPEQTAQVLRQGWIYTADLGTWDEDGRIRLCGRRRDILKDLQGNIIFPSAIEAALVDHPAVCEAAVCGFVDALGDERIAAFVVAKDEAGEALAAALNTLVRDRLGPSAVPRRIMFFDELPRSNGKVAKSWLLERLQTQDAGNA